MGAYLPITNLWVLELISITTKPDIYLSIIYKLFYPNFWYKRPNPSNWKQRKTLQTSEKVTDSLLLLLLFNWLIVLCHCYGYPSPKTESSFSRFGFSFAVMDAGRIDPIRSGVGPYQMHSGGYQEQCNECWEIPNRKPPDSHNITVRVLFLV